MNLIVDSSETSSIGEDIFKLRYLAGIDSIDRPNLEQVVRTLESGMPSSTRILAVGSSVMRKDEGTMPYNDIDLLIFGTPKDVPLLGKLAYRVLSRLSGVNVDTRYLKGILSTRLQQLRRDYEFKSGLIVHPETGKNIDVFISVIPIDRYFERNTRPYVVLH